jgi:uncharacterized protein YcbX
MAGRVARISIAPVKSLGLVHPDLVDLGAGGVPGDRRFWMVNREGRLVNGKICPAFMQIRPAWDEQTRVLRLHFPDGETVEGVVEPGEPFAASLYGEPHPSRRVPGPWQDALAAYAGMEVTLLWSEVGAADRGGAGGWASLVSTASLDRLAAAAEAARVDGRRFRMLFEIEGVGAHEEDEWIGRKLAVGDAVIAPAGDVGRCVVTKCDPDTGVSDLDTLGALARYRREGRTEPLPLGIYADVVTPGRVRVGDPVALMPAA